MTEFQRKMLALQKEQLESQQRIEDNIEQQQFQEFIEGKLWVPPKSRAATQLTAGQQRFIIIASSIVGLIAFFAMLPSLFEAQSGASAGNDSFSRVICYLFIAMVFGSLFKGLKV